MRVDPDDEVYRVNTVWLGPRGFTFPWTARYVAYAVWLLAFLVILLVEAVTPLHVSALPVWEISIATFLTYFVMGFVDHDRPVAAVWQTFVADISAPRRSAPRVVVTSTRKVRIGQGRGESAVAGASARTRRSGGGRRVRAVRKVG